MVPVYICSHVLQRGHEVERHQFGRVDGHHPIDVPRAKRLDVTLYCPFDFGFIVFLVFFDGHSFLLPLACCESQVIAVICAFWGEAADFLALLLLKAPPFLSPVKPCSRDEVREHGKRALPGEGTSNSPLLPNMDVSFLTDRDKISVQDSYTRRNTLCVCDNLSLAHSTSRLRHHSTSPERRE